MSCSCLDKYPGKVIRSWTGADGKVIDPGEYALSADDGIRRRDDDSEFDPESVYAPLMEATPRVEEIEREPALNSIVMACGSGIRIEGWGNDVTNNWLVNL